MKYVKFFPAYNMYAFEKRRLKGCAFNIGYGDAGDVLATDMKKGFWYFTYDKKIFFGPFRSAQQARRAYDNSKSLITENARVAQR